MHPPRCRRQLPLVEVAVAEAVEAARLEEAEEPDAELAEALLELQRLVEVLPVAADAVAVGQPVEALQQRVHPRVAEPRVAADEAAAVVPLQQRHRRSWAKASTRSRADIAWLLWSSKTTWS